MADPLVDLLWSLWTELGVPGVVRRHESVVIDPEPLVVVTPRLAQADPRLLQLAFDWCVEHGARLRRQRIAALADESRAPTRGQFAGFAADLQEAGGPRWAPQEGSLELARDREVVALPLERPALARLRLRAVCGVSTRAEVLARLLQRHERPRPARDLVPSGVSRGSADRVLLDLREAGITRVEGGARRRRHRLASVESWREILGAEDLAWWDWWAAFQLVEVWDGLRTLEGSPAVRRVEAVRHREELATCARRLGVEEPPRVEGESEAWERLVQWGAAAVERLCRPRDDTGAA